MTDAELKELALKVNESIAVADPRFVSPEVRLLGEAVPNLLERIAALRLTLTIVYSSNQNYAKHMGDPNATVDYVPAVMALAADDARITEDNNG